MGGRGGGAALRGVEGAGRRVGAVNVNCWHGPFLPPLANWKRTVRLFVGIAHSSAFALVRQGPIGRAVFCRTAIFRAASCLRCACLMGLRARLGAGRGPPQFLMARPERHLAVVSHGGLLMWMLRPAGEAWRAPPGWNCADGVNPLPSNILPRHSFPPQNEVTLAAESSRLLCPPALPTHAAAHLSPPLAARLPCTRPPVPAVADGPAGAAPRRGLPLLLPLLHAASLWARRGPRGAGRAAQVVRPPARHAAHLPSTLPTRAAFCAHRSSQPTHRALHARPVPRAHSLTSHAHHSPRPRPPLKHTQPYNP